MVLTSDANGNLTDDGVFKYKYDWLSRLVQVSRREDAQTIVALYAYDGLNRRIRKDVTNTGIAIVPGSDAGGVTGISCGDRVEGFGS
ncbi:MAG: hypothetical protein ACKVS9_09250 [Phycisphaerae bacterium]